jgi:ribosomal protein S6E (S10)
MDGTIRSAISAKAIIEFDYDGHHRIAEPHLYGSKNGVVQLLVFQVAGGSSSGGLPQWRRVDVARMSNLIIANQRFPGRRPNPSGEHSAFDAIWAVVD